MPSVAYLGLGSNIDARKNIASGIAALREAFDDVQLSPCYESPSYGFTGADFINLVAHVETGMSPLALKQFLHDLEDRHDRRRDAPRFSDRTLDIDILLYDDLVLISPALEIPRNEILTAPHVLKPLADLASDLRHPLNRRTFAELWREMDSGKTQLRLIEL
jgi:2-amino-4-hydroxy-6-hydroxymethyldihydropteridine diphosphokinase